MMINFSVVIPCYNSSKTIEDCLNSVFKQIYKPKEIIVIDDGSTDDTFYKLDDLKKKCPEEINLIIFKQINSGPSVARNNGIKLASNNWIAFLDSDDCWIKSHLEELSITFYKNPEVSIIGVNSRSVSKKIHFNELLYKNYFQTSSVIVKKEVILKYLFNENQKYSEDFRTWLLILYHYEGYILKAEHAFPIKDRLLVYSGGGLSSNLNAMQKGEIDNFIYLLQNKMITNIEFFKVIIFSYLKFFRRKYLKLKYNLYES